MRIREACPLSTSCLAAEVFKLGLIPLENTFYVQVLRNVVNYWSWVPKKARIPTSLILWVTLDKSPFITVSSSIKWEILLSWGFLWGLDKDSIQEKCNINTKRSASQTGVNCLFQQEAHRLFWLRSADVCGARWSSDWLSEFQGSGKQNSIPHKLATFYSRKKPKGIKFDLTELCKYVQIMHTTKKNGILSLPTKKPKPENKPTISPLVRFS